MPLPVPAILSYYGIEPTSRNNHLDGEIEDEELLKEWLEKQGGRVRINIP